MHDVLLLDKACHITEMHNGQHQGGKNHFHTTNVWDNRTPTPAGVLEYPFFMQMTDPTVMLSVKRMSLSRVSVCVINGQKGANPTTVCKLKSGHSRNKHERAKGAKVTCALVCVYRVELTGSEYERRLEDKKIAIKEDEAALEAEMEFAQKLRSGEYDCYK